MTAVLAGAAVLIVWLVSLYAHPFGRCWRCRGTGHVIRAGGRRATTCPRCHGLGRIQRTGSRTVHRAVRAVRKGQAAGIRHQPQEED